MKVLIIDDEIAIAATLKDELEKDYTVDFCFTGKDGEYQAKLHHYDLIILDLGLPDKNGKQVCKNLRSMNIKSLILVLSGNHDLQSKLSLLDLGADDYLTKPFSIKELKARMRALSRRKLHRSSSSLIKIDDLILNLNTKSAKRGTRSIVLRRKEFSILEYLVRNAGQIVTRDMILNNVWNHSSDSTSNLVDVHIKYLRDKMDKPFSKKLIRTVQGSGYTIEK